MPETISVPPTLSGEHRSVLSAREAQRAWGELGLSIRLAMVRRLREWIAEHALELAAAIHLPQRTRVADSLSCEVLPLAEACRFLERRATLILSPTKPSAADRPLWLAGVDLQIQHVPRGVILIVGPSNYPLFLPGVQLLQALVAGNAVLLKPGRNGGPVAWLLWEGCRIAGFDPKLFQIVSEDVAEVEMAIKAGVDLVVLTGSHAAGQAVLNLAAESITPTILELSGCDAVIVAADADLNLATRAILFGLGLNGGATCIAPRRVYVAQPLKAPLEARLFAAVKAMPMTAVDETAARLARQLARAAIAGGAQLLQGELNDELRYTPILLTNVPPDAEILQTDLFVPTLCLMAVADEREAIERANACRYGLGAAIFAAPRTAARIAKGLRVGSITMNDLIVPTADPRFPFGGRGDSGYGVTRGAAGLLSMTVPKAIACRRSGWLPHLDPPHTDDAEVLHSLVLMLHARSLMQRFRALLQLLKLTAGRFWRRKPATVKDSKSCL